MRIHGARLAIVCSALALASCSVELSDAEGPLARALRGPIHVDLARLEARASDYDGREIIVVAEPRAVAICTLMACVPENACCNGCSASFRIGRRVELESAIEDRPFACAGDDCTWADSCTPFPAAEAGRYKLRGQLRVGEGERLTLRVQTYRALDCQKTGCNREMCANGRVPTLCAFEPKYACYASAACRSQPDGSCGFTPTRELEACLARVP